MKRLCRRLCIRTWQAVGVLESTWHLTARETPAGNIGKLSNEDIVLAIDYDGDENELIEALIETGWMDRDLNGHRLVIHDWSHHADDATHMKLARARQFFADGRAPKLTKLTGNEREAAAEFYGSCAQTSDPCAREQGPQSATAVPCAQQSDPCAQNRSSCALPEPHQSPAPPKPSLAMPTPATATSSSASGSRLESDKADDHAAAGFVDKVRAIWLELGIACGPWTNGNERIARQQFALGVTPEQMERAMLWGAAQRYKHTRNNGADRKIVSLQYFVSCLDNEDLQKASNQQLQHMITRCQGDARGAA